MPTKTTTKSCRRRRSTKSSSTTCVVVAKRVAIHTTTATTTRHAGKWIIIETAKSVISRHRLSSRLLLRLLLLYIILSCCILLVVILSVLNVFLCNLVSNRITRDYMHGHANHSNDKRDQKKPPKQRVFIMIFLVFHFHLVRKKYSPYKSGAHGIAQRCSNGCHSVRFSDLINRIWYRIARFDGEKQFKQLFNGHVIDDRECDKTQMTNGEK
mmetsp:Transcript_52145/g.86280  ORF Transcript_52145/g.86280 Transcript_52145/m.86280 type:complete len:212 (+) Transcript_52145:483-1118(+)